MFLKIKRTCLEEKLVNIVSYSCTETFQKRKLRTFNVRDKLSKVHTQNEKIANFDEKKKNLTTSGNLFERIKKADLKLLKRMENSIENDIYKKQEDKNNSYNFDNTRRVHYDEYDNEKMEELGNDELRCNEYKFIFERPKHYADINDDPIIRRPGCIIDIKTLMRNNWTFPAVGFNSKLEIPIYKFETDKQDEENGNHHDQQDGNCNVKYISVPNDIFGLPIRSDILHKCYYFYRSALAGYTERMQLYKWEWPGSTKKYRSQKKSGKARMNWRKTCGRYLGVKNHPIRPFDQRTKINRKLLWKGMKILLSAKFAQDQIKVVDHFLVKSHKTKYTVKYLRNILGTNCNSALLVHEGKTDMNDNFAWACANIASIKRENVEGVNIYNLLKYRYVVFTYKALKNIMYELKIYPYKMKWLPTYATPDNSKAPKPQKVKNWNIFWLEKKKRNQFSYFDKDALKKRIQEWKWSSDLKGPLKVKKHDPYKNFILTKFQCNDPPPEYIRYEYLFNVDKEVDNVYDDSEGNFPLVDEILHDDECLGYISDLSTPLWELREKKTKELEDKDKDDEMITDENTLGNGEREPEDEEGRSEDSDNDADEDEDMALDEENFDNLKKY
ncbi:ribosomal protein L4 [Plasmodium brasilianum]|uniref:Ribosomal protein L4 n=2 Tax=Plasmodium (Plasmodium) TaxID=418103 RepID=A0ACB9YE40_PLABR|nr:ribosomal protein L4 [Plasmodium brasilianum]